MQSAVLSYRFNNYNKTQKLAGELSKKTQNKGVLAGWAKFLALYKEIMEYFHTELLICSQTIC